MATITPTPQQMVDRINQTIYEVVQGKRVSFRDGTTGAERMVDNHDLSELQSLLAFYEAKLARPNGMQFKHANLSRY